MSGTLKRVWIGDLNSVFLIFLVQFSLFLIIILPVNLYSLYFRTPVFSVLYFVGLFFYILHIYCPFFYTCFHFSIIFFELQSRLVNGSSLRKPSVLNLFHKIKSFDADFIFPFFNHLFKRLEINAETSSLILFSSLVSDLQ